MTGLDAEAVAWAAAWPPVWAVSWPYVWHLMARGRTVWGFWGSWITASACTVLADALAGYLPATAVAAASTIFAVIMWWLSRRRRKRAPKLAGAKSKAILAAVVAKMRECLKPRQVLRPQPQGAS